MGYIIIRAQWHKIVEPILANCGVARWTTIKNDRLVVPLTNEPYSTNAEQ